MFCSQCGIQLEDGSTYCPSCGKVFSNISVSTTPTSVTVSSSAHYGKSAHISKSFDVKNPKVLGIAAVAAVVVVVLLFSMLFGGQSYKQAVNNFMEGVFDGDAKQVLKALPDDVIDQMCDEADMSKREMIAYMDDALDEVMEELEYYAGSNWSVKHKITGTEKYDFDDLRDIKEEYDEIDVKVKDAKIVIVEMTVKAAGMSQSIDMEIGVIKVGGSWYVDVQNVDLPF